MVVPHLLPRALAYTALVHHSASRPQAAARTPGLEHSPSWLVYWPVPHTACTGSGARRGAVNPAATPEHPVLLVRMHAAEPAGLDGVAYSSRLLQWPAALDSSGTAARYVLTNVLGALRLQACPAWI
ncbi:hypothetical protein C8R45DRAFT_1108206 [Mycena sanguinolenta]|nr:hypothetical protein C8R45DRAFT_1108206 [Mycena sanguinolenta]